MKYYSCYGVVKFHTFNNIPLKKKCMYFSTGFQNFSDRGKNRGRGAV